MILYVCHTLKSIFEMEEKGEIVLYQPDEPLRLDVLFQDKTVWLNMQQIATLFNRDKSVISRHIKNIFVEKELVFESVVAFFATTANDGKTYRVEYYNLDVIISIGYRVKSLQGTRFRQWATSKLTDVLLHKNFTIQRIERLEHRMMSAENKIDFFIQTSLPPIQGIFFNGEIFDAYKFANDLIRSANSRIVVIDNYIDDTVLSMLGKCKNTASVIIYTARVSEQLRLDLEKYNSQYKPIQIIEFNKSHDRFLIIDNIVYLIGASLKDLGKKMFAFSRLEISATELLEHIHLTV